MKNSQLLSLLLFPLLSFSAPTRECTREKAAGLSTTPTSSTISPASNIVASKSFYFIANGDMPLATPIQAPVPTTSAGADGNSNIEPLKDIKPTETAAVDIATVVQPTQAMTTTAVPTYHPNNSQLIPDISTAKLSQFIPWSESTNKFNLTPKVNLEIDGHVYNGVTMDTGSMGITVPMAKLKDFNPPDPPKGWKFLSSSKLLYVGYWTIRNVTFIGASNKTLMRSVVPMLAVKYTQTCWGHINDDGAKCRNISHTNPSPTGTYLGVGFGREQDGMVQTTPNTNPFLYPHSFSGVPVDPSLRAGYVINATGVSVGLTLQNTDGFLFSKLTMQQYSSLQSDSSHEYDWNQTTMCISVDEQPCLDGTLLVDTGIDNMYLSSSYHVTEQSVIDIKFPNNSTTPIAEYSFENNNIQSPLDPAKVIPTFTKPRTFINTGRHFLNGYDVAFDAVGGYFGMRKVTDDTP